MTLYIIDVILQKKGGRDSTCHGILQGVRDSTTSHTKQNLKKNGWFKKNKGGWNAASHSGFSLFLLDSARHGFLLQIKKKKNSSNKWQCFKKEQVDGFLQCVRDSDYFWKKTSVFLKKKVDETQRLPVAYYVRETLRLLNVTGANKGEDSNKNLLTTNFCMENSYRDSFWEFYAWELYACDFVTFECYARERR